jgi:hypothetical protein
MMQASQGSQLFNYIQSITSYMLKSKLWCRLARAVSCQLYPVHHQLHAKIKTIWCRLARAVSCSTTSSPSPATWLPPSVLCIFSPYSGLGNERTFPLFLGCFYYTVYKKNCHFPYVHKETILLNFFLLLYQSEWRVRKRRRLPFSIRSINSRRAIFLYP